jgi:hypothetical protein
MSMLVQEAVVDELIVMKPDLKSHGNLVRA